MTTPQALRALAAAATPRPWYVDGPEFGGLWVCCGSSDVSGPVHPSHPDQPYAVLAGMGEADAAYIVAAANAVPDLLDELDELRGLAKTGASFAHLEGWGIFSHHTGTIWECEEQRCIQARELAWTPEERQKKAARAALEGADHDPA